MAGVVLDAVAIAQFAQHLKVKLGALPQPLRLQQLVLTFQLDEPFVQFGADPPDRSFDPLPGHHEVLGRGDDRARQPHLGLAGHRIKFADVLHVVAEKIDPDAGGLVGREDIHAIAAHAKRTRLRFVIIAGVLDIDQPLQHRVATQRLAGHDVHQHGTVILRRAQTVNARDRSHDHHITSAEQGIGRAQPVALDLIIDRGVLLDVSVGLRNVGFRLVVVVIADKVLDRIMREEAFEFREKLRRQGLVVGDDNGRASPLADHISHRKGFARAGHTLQRQTLRARLQPLRQLLDRLRLIAGRRKVRHHRKLCHSVLHIPSLSHPVPVL